MKTASPSLKQQLEPIAAKLRETRAQVRPISQVSLQLRGDGKRDRFAVTVDAILRWASNRAGRKLPDVAWHRKSFELSEIGSQRFAAVALEDPHIWAARLDDADKAVPLRTWVTEVGVGVAPEGDVLFGVRLICTTRGEGVTFERSIPGFVRNIVEAGPAFLDAVPVQHEPRFAASERDVDDLVRLLESPSRRAPVLVFALPESSSDPAQTVISAVDFQRRTLGAVHVYVLTGSASFWLTDRLGKEMSVFRQAVRTYLPGFKRWSDQPFRHPLALPDRIAAWADGGASGYLNWLVSQTLAMTVQAPDRETELPSFTTVRQAAAKLERAQARDQQRTDADMSELYRADNEKLRDELQEQYAVYRGLLDQVEGERDEAVQQAQQAKAQNFALRERIGALEKTVVEIRGSARSVEIPVDLADFETWCRQTLSGGVVLHNRAFQGVKRSVFREPELLYKALLLLQEHYVPMRRDGSPERRMEFERACRKLRLEDSAVGEGWRGSKDQYTVTYDGRPRLFERHLKQGTSHDPAICFRLYYFWDDDSQVVVVGWLPSHLDNSLT